MHFLSVGAVFRNESDGIVEWIKHYLHHGVDHFYLINDNSDDDTVSKIQEYIDKGIVTLYHAKENYYLGRQRNVYNRFFLQHMQQKDTQWLLIVDLDEYVWSPRAVHLGSILRLECSELGQIQIQQYLYGSNGHVKQPESIVKHFTKRSHAPLRCLKYFINSNFEFTSINIHHADFAVEANKTNASVFIIINMDFFLFNHYSCQSVEFWQNIKCTRGDGDAYIQRDMTRFHEIDVNDVEDTRLLEHYMDILP